MNGGGGGARKEQRDQGNQDVNTKNASAAMSNLGLEPDAMGEKSHTASEGCVCTKVAVSQERG